MAGVAALGQLVLVSHSSLDGATLGRHLTESFLDKDYTSELHITSIHKIVNPELERQYLQKKSEMHAVGRTREELKEVFGFTVAKKSMSYLKKIVNDGLTAQRTDYNAFGDSAKGVYISRHCDVMLKFAETHKTKFLRIIVHKLIPGRLLATDEGPAVQPTPQYDGHESPKKPEVQSKVEQQVMLSQLYIYELDEQDNPVSHPRQSLPYAVFTFEPNKSIPRPLNSQQQQPSQATVTTSTTSRATSQQQQTSLVTATVVPQQPTTKLITLSRNQQSTQVTQTQVRARAPAAAATSSLTAGHSTTFAPRTPNSPLSQAQFSGMSGLATFTVPTSSGTLVPPQGQQIVRILRANSSTIRQILAHQATLPPGQRIVVPMAPGKQTSLLSPTKSTPTRGRGRGRGQSRGRGASSALGRASVAGTGAQQTASSTMGYQYTLPPSGSVVFPANVSFSTATNLNQGLQSGNTAQTILSAAPVGSATRVNQVIQPKSPQQIRHTSYAHGSVSNMSVCQGMFTPNVSAVTTVSSDTLTNNCPISIDPDFGSVTPIEIAPIEGYGETPQTAPIEGYGETLQIAPIEGYREVSPTVAVKREKSRSTGHRRQRTTSIIDLISDEETVPEVDDQQSDSSGRPTSSVDPVPIAESQDDQPYSQQGQPEELKEQQELLQQKGIQDAQNEVTSQSNPISVEPVTTVPSRVDLNGTCDSEAAVASDNSAKDPSSRTGEPEPKMVLHQFVQTNDDGTVEVMDELVLESELRKRQAESTRLTSAHNWDLDSEDDEGGDTSLELTSPDKTRRHEVARDLTETHNSKPKITNVQSQEKLAETLSMASESVQRKTMATPSVSSVSTLPAARLSEKRPGSVSGTMDISSGIESESGRTSPQLGFVISSVTSAADAGSSVDSVSVKHEEGQTETESSSSPDKAVKISGLFIPSAGNLADVGPHFDMSCLSAGTSELTDDASDTTVPDTSPVLDESNKMNYANCSTKTPQEKVQQPTETVSSSSASNKMKKNNVSVPKKKRKVPRQPKPDKMVHGKVRKINLEDILSRVYDTVDSRPPSTSSISSGVRPEPDYQPSDLPADDIHNFDDTMNSDTMSLGELRPTVPAKTFGPLECKEAKNDPAYQPYVRLIDVNDVVEEPTPSSPTPSSPVHYSDIDYDVPKPKMKRKKKTSLPQWNTKAILQWSPNKRKLLTARKSVTKGSLKPIKPVTLSHPRFATNSMSLSFTTTTLLGSVDSLCGASNEKPSTSSLDKTDEDIPETTKSDLLSPIIPLVDVLNDTSLLSTPQRNEEKVSADKSEELCETTSDPTEQDLTTPTSDEKVGAGQVQTEPSSEGGLNRSVQKPKRGRQIKRRRPSKLTTRKLKLKAKAKPKQDIHESTSSGNESNLKRRKSVKEKVIPVRRGRSLKALFRVDYAEKVDEPQPVYMAQLKNTESEFKRLVQEAAQEAIAEKSGIDIPLVTNISTPATKNKQPGIDIPLGTNISTPATRNKLPPAPKGKKRKKKGKSSQVEPFFDPKIPFIRDDPTYVERTMYKPEIPGILDDKSESKATQEKGAPPSETETSSAKKDAETKESQPVADALTLGSEDDELFLALLKSRLKKAKNVDEAEKLKNLIAEYCPVTAEPEDTKEGSSQSASATDQSKAGQTKPIMKINLDDYDYGDDEESTKAVLPSTPKPEPETVVTVELDDEELTLDTQGLAHTNHLPDEALVGLQDERWKILHELEDCEDEEEKQVDAEAKDDKPSNKSAGGKKKLPKRKRKRRSEDKAQKEISDAAVLNEECQNSSAHQENVDYHTQMHHERKGKSGRKRTLSSGSGSNSDEGQLKSIPGESEKTRKKKHSHKDKKRTSAGSEVGDKSKVKVQPKKTLYTDSEVMRNMMSPKAVNKKEVRANLFDGYGSEGANPLNVSSDPDQWMQKLQQINLTALNLDETNVLQQILKSTEPQSTSTDDIADTSVDQDKDGAAELVKVQENAVDKGSEHTKVLSKPVEVEKEKPAKVKLKLGAYLARNTEKEKKPPHVPDKRPIKDVTAALLTETSNELQLNVARTVERKTPHVPEEKPIKDVTALLLTDTSNELQLNVGHRMDSSMKDEPVKILHFEDIKKILDTVKMNDVICGTTSKDMTNDAATHSQEPPEEKKRVMPIQNDPRIILGARGIKIKDSKSQHKSVLTAQEPDDEISPARRISYLQRNMEQIQIKRKELVQELNCLKKKTDTPEGRNPRLRQEIQILDHFIRGLYIDEEIIKKEMDNIRGNVKAQVNQAVPVELLLPEETAQQQTADDVPLFLMSKLLDETYGNLLSLKFDYIATSAEWKKTNVLDSDKKRSLQRNFGFIKDTRRRKLSGLCGQPKDFRSKLKEYYEKMAWYQKHHDEFLRDYTRTPNPCTEARIRHMDIRIAELHTHVKHIRRVMGLPAESTKALRPEGAGPEAAKPEAAQSKPGPVPQVNQKPKEKTDTPASSSKSESINTSAETLASHSTGSASQDGPPPAFLRGDAIINKEQPLSFPTGELPPWLRKKEGAEKKEEVQADQNEKEIPPWLRKRKNIEETEESTPSTEQNNPSSTYVEESTVVSKTGSSLTCVPPVVITKKMPERRPSIESSILLELQEEAAQLRLGEEQRPKDIAAASSQSDMSLCSVIELDISLDASLSDGPDAGQQSTTVKDSSERDLRNELAISRDASARDLRNVLSVTTADHSAVAPSAATAIPVLVTRTEISEPVLKTQPFSEVSSIPVIVNVNRMSQIEKPAQEDIMVPEGGSTTQSITVKPTILSENASQSKTSKTHESDKGTSSSVNKIDYRRRSSTETKARTSDRGHSESRSSTSSRSSSSRSENHDRRITMKHSNSTEHRSHHSSGNKTQTESKHSEYQKSTSSTKSDHKRLSSTEAKPRDSGKSYSTRSPSVKDLSDSEYHKSTSSTKSDHKRLSSIEAKARDSEKSYSTRSPSVKDLSDSEYHKSTSSTKSDHKRLSSSEAKARDSGKSYSTRSPSVKDISDSKSRDHNRYKTKRFGSVDHINNDAKESQKSAIGKPSTHGVEPETYIRTENEGSDMSRITSVGTDSGNSTPSIVDLTIHDSPEKVVNHPEIMEESSQSSSISNHQCSTGKDDFSVISEEEDMLDTSGTLLIVIPDDSPVPKLISLEQEKPELNEKIIDITNIGASGENLSPRNIGPTKQGEDEMRIGAGEDCVVSTASADNELSTNQQEETGPHISNEIRRLSMTASPFDDDIVITMTMQLTREQLLKQVLQRKTTLSQKLAENEQSIKKENTDNGHVSKDTVDDDDDDGDTLVIDEDRVPTSSVQEGIKSTETVDDELEIIEIANKAHETTPIVGEERATTPIWDEQRDTTPIRAEQRPTTPIRDEQRAVTPIRDEQCATTPIRDEQCATTPVKDEKYATTAIRDEQRETKLIRDEQRATTPIRDEQLEMTPIRDKQRETTPIRDEQRNTTPIRDEQYATTEIRDERRETTLIRDDQRETTPIRDEQCEKTLVMEEECDITPIRNEELEITLIRDEQHQTTPLMDEGSKTTTIPDVIRYCTNMKDVTGKAPRVSTLKKSSNKVSKLSKWDKKPKPSKSEAHITITMEDSEDKIPNITNVDNFSDEVHGSINMKNPADGAREAIELEDSSNGSQETTIEKSIDKISKTTTVKSPLERAHRSPKKGSPKKGSHHRIGGSHKSTMGKHPSRRQKYSEVGIKETSSEKIGNQETIPKEDEVLISSPSRPSKPAKTDGESKLTKQVRKKEGVADTPKPNPAKNKKAAAQADALIAFIKQDIAAKEKPVERQQEDCGDSLSSNDPNEIMRELPKGESVPSLEATAGGNDQYRVVDSASRRQAYKQKGRKNSAASVESGSTDISGSSWKNFPQRYKQPAWSSDRSLETDDYRAKTDKASMERSPSPPTRTAREGSYHSHSQSPSRHHSKSPPRSLKRKREETFAADNEWERDTGQQTYRDRQVHRKRSPSSLERSTWRREPHQLSRDRGTPHARSTVTRDAREGRGFETRGEHRRTREDCDRIPRRRTSPGGSPWKRESRPGGSSSREVRYRSPKRSPSPETISWSRNVRAANEARRSPNRREVRDRSPIRRGSQERSPPRRREARNPSPPIREMTQYSHHSRSGSPYSRGSASPPTIRSPSPQSRCRTPSPSSWEYHHHQSYKGSNNPRGTAYAEGADTRAVSFGNPAYGQDTQQQFYESQQNQHAQHNYRGRGANRQRMHYRDLRERLVDSHQGHYTDDAEPVRQVPPYPIVDDQQQWQQPSQTNTSSHWQSSW